MQNLENRTPIVNPDGTPTEYFMRLLQNRGGILGDLADKQILGGIGINGGGPLGEPGDITLDADVQEILDQISTTQGSVLYRGATDWAALAPGAVGEFLKTNGVGANPSWAIAGAGGSTWNTVGTWDFAIAGAVATVVSSSLAGFNECLILTDAATRSVAGQHAIRVSTDNGATYYNTSGDYTSLSNNGVKANSTAFAPMNLSTVAASTWIARVLNLKGAWKSANMVNQTGFPAWQFGASANDITNVQVTALVAGNWNGGKIRILAR